MEASGGGGAKHGAAVAAVANPDDTCAQDGQEVRLDRPGAGVRQRPTPIWLGATPVQEAMHLEHLRQRRLEDERANAEQRMQREWEEEEECAHVATLPPPQQTPEEAALAAYQAAFYWTGPPPVFIDLTGGDGDGDGDVKGKGKTDNI